MRLFDFLKSKTDHKVSLHTGTDDPWELVKLATAYHDKGQIDHAIAVLKKAYPLMARRDSQWRKPHPHPINRERKSRSLFLQKCF